MRVNAQLPLVAQAGYASSGFTRPAESRQQESGKYCNDGNDNQQLDQCKRA